MSSLATDDINVIARRAMRRQLLTVDCLPPEAAQQWEGLVATFTPPNDGAEWMRETVLRQPGPPMRASVGTYARIRNSGIYTIDLFYPSDEGSGVARIESVGGAIRTAFPFSLVLIDSGQQITCEGCGLSGVRPDAKSGRPMLTMSARIPYWADTFNPI